MAEGIAAIAAYVASAVAVSGTAAYAVAYAVTYAVASLAAAYSFSALMGRSSSLVRRTASAQKPRGALRSCAPTSSPGT